MRIISILLLIFTLASCESETKKNLKPSKNVLAFEEPLIGLKRINLNKALGDTFELSQHSDHPRQFTIEYDRKTKENTIYELGKGLFYQGQVGKYKNLYFLNSSASAGYTIQAFSLNKNTIKGFLDQSIQRDQLKNRAKSGLLDDLLSSEESGGSLLKTDKKLLAKLFAEFLLDAQEWDFKTLENS